MEVNLSKRCVYMGNATLKKMRSKWNYRKMIEGRAVWLLQIDEM